MQTLLRRKFKSRFVIGFISIFTALGLFVTSDLAHAFGGCDKTPSSQAVRRAQIYYDANRNVIEHSSNTRQGSPGRKIVINDYTQTPPQMFVLDPSRADKMGYPVCLFNFPVDFGKGGGPSPRPGCGHNSKMTPPGFHITTENAGGSKYPYPEGMGMISCEGQESFARGVKVHAGPGRGQGRSATWGCPAITDENFEKFLREVRGGSLMYNYFGDDEANALGCKQPIATNPKCTPELSGGNSGPQPRNYERRGSAK